MDFFQFYITTHMDSGKVIHPYTRLGLPHNAPKIDFMATFFAIDFMATFNLSNHQYQLKRSGRYHVFYAYPVKPSFHFCSTDEAIYKCIIHPMSFVLPLYELIDCIFSPEKKNHRTHKCAYLLKPRGQKSVRNKSIISKYIFF